MTDYKSVQIRQVKNGYIIVTQTDTMNEEGEVTHRHADEWVSGSNVDYLCKIVRSFLQCLTTLKVPLDPQYEDNVVGGTDVEALFRQYQTDQKVTHWPRGKEVL